MWNHSVLLDSIIRMLLDCGLVRQWQLVGDLSLVRSYHIKYNCNSNYKIFVNESINSTFLNISIYGNCSLLVVFYWFLEFYHVIFMSYLVYNAITRDLFLGGSSYSIRFPFGHLCIDGAVWECCRGSCCELRCCFQRMRGSCGGRGLSGYHFIRPWDFKNS
jgi:hypothetical protein